MQKKASIIGELSHFQIGRYDVKSNYKLNNPIKKKPIKFLLVNQCKICTKIRVKNTKNSEENKKDWKAQPMRL